MRNVSKTEKTYADITLLEPFDIGDFFIKTTVPEEFRFDIFKKFLIMKIENFKHFITLPSEPNRRTLNLFMYITKGLVIRTKGLTKYELKPNTFFFLPAYEIGSLDYISDDAEGYFCQFSTELFNQNSSQALIKGDSSFLNIILKPVLEIKNKRRIVQLLNILEDDCMNITENRAEYIAIYLYALFKELHIHDTEDAIPHNSAGFITQGYKKALTEFIYEFKSVAEFSGHLAVTPNHLNKCVKLTTGKSALELLNEMKILEAKVLLKQTSLTITEIAYKLGKYEVSDFSRFFKSKTKKTPLEYRQNK
jgi:AraC family transcriptional activator of pobA